MTTTTSLATAISFHPTNVPQATFDPALALHDRWLRVELSDGETADFHYRWLRHRCDCDRHPQTGERLLCSSEIPDDIRPQSAVLDRSATNNDLVVTWSNDGHVSRYDRTWLRDNAYARNRPAPISAAVAVSVLEVYVGNRALNDVVDNAIEKLATHRAAIVRRGSASWLGPGVAPAPEDETELLIEAFAKRGLTITSTHFGRIEDLRTDNTSNANTDQLGYTDAAIDLHTDQPFIEHPPRYQVLQCLRPADGGGDNILVDGHAALALLAAEDAHAAHLLTTVPVRFSRRQAKFQRDLISPIATQRADGSIQLRFSYFTLAPYALPFAELEDYYRAHDRFARLVRNANNQVRFRLEPGDFVIYDNHQMLHGRTAFHGPRWVRGIYLDPAISS